MSKWCPEKVMDTEVGVEEPQAKEPLKVAGAERGESKDRISSRALKESTALSTP